jgi:hypothetical protein
MKQLLAFIANQAQEHRKVLDDLVAKYEAKNNFDLLRKSDIDPIDREMMLQHAYGLDSLTKVANFYNRVYSGGVFVDDTDVDCKRRAIYDVAEIVLDRVSKEGSPEWDRMNGVPTEQILHHVPGLLMSGELEVAHLGITYALYQKHVQQTNRADKKLEELGITKKEDNNAGPTHRPEQPAAAHLPELPEGESA